MADEQHLALLNQGADVWNNWRQKNDACRVDLRAADLSGAHLDGVVRWSSNFGQIAKIGSCS
jgi:hypothetical protein